MSMTMIAALKEMPIAIKTDDPKAQHYELPTSFFKLVLGAKLKYRYSLALQIQCICFVFIKKTKYKYIQVAIVLQCSFTCGYVFLNHVFAKMYASVSRPF